MPSMMEQRDPRDPKNWIPRELFAAYLGPHSDDMLAYYDKAVSKKSALSVSFSPLALLMLPAWLGLRQQWAMWATFTGLIGVLPFVERGLGIAIPSSAFVGTGIAMGLMGRGLLLLNANAQYLKLTNKGLTGPALHEALRDRARLNIPFAVAAGVGSLMIIFGLAHLAAILSGQPFP